MIAISKQNGVGTFLSGCIQLYEEMSVEIKVVQLAASLPEEERIQACFEIAGNYKEKINEAVRTHSFVNSADEIFFFKHVKPLFQAEVEFYTYCYHKRKINNEPA